MIRQFAPLLILPLAACSFTPHAERPSVTLPAQFAGDPNWRPANPSDDGPKGDWWTAFNDPVLTDLEGRVVKANQTIAAAVASYDEARAVVGENRSNLLPSVNASANASKSQTFSGAATTNQSGGQITSGTTHYSVSASASWTLDFFGGLRSTLAQSKASAAASAGDLANAILAAQGELALNYLQLRAVDAQRQIDTATIEAYTKALTITQNRYNQGVAARIDVLQAQTQLKNTQAEATDLERQRAVLTHAIAVLVGESPSLFTLAQVDHFAANVPQVPAILPAELLERRPDIAAAERRVAAANEGVGIAKSAFFPTFALTPSVSSNSSQFSQLLSASSSLWSLGGNVAATLFDFGGRLNKVRGAKASYAQTVAQYRGTVLTAFQQVEDDLAGVNFYATEEAQRRAASEQADRVEAITLNQYKAGIVAYSNVITAQATALSTRQAAITATSNRQQATVSLIQAIGGGWDHPAIK
jgi:NodT family efflux transporter outer membrane factor (OMF) lipoprotein